jgi:pimeloyl-ACP methyl ester carboxylesterase
MRVRFVLLLAMMFLAPGIRLRAQEAKAWWGRDVDEALAKSKGNRGELEDALRKVPETQRVGLAFLIVNMPDRDLTSLKSAYLLNNLELAYSVRVKMPWGKQVPEGLFLNDVLPYASVTETREPWRQAMMDRCLPIVKDCKNLTEAAQALNANLFKNVKVRYSVLRGRPDQSPAESMKSGIASCTGLSILLADACRSVGVPARLVGIPKWVGKPGNHTWVEIWDGDWHFTGACEHDPSGLDRAWFVGDAALAKKDSIESAIYAASFKRTKTRFPLVWERGNKDVSAVNVTERYTRSAKTTVAATDPGCFSEQEHKRIFEAARKWFDNPTAEPKFAKEIDDLLKTHDAEVRAAVWDGYKASKIHADLKADYDKNQVTDGKWTSPYTVKRVGKKPAGGWPVFIAMHGGGGVPKAINDSQWEQMKGYYRDQKAVEGYLYVALRAPNDVWNGFYDDYMCPLVIKLIRQFALFGEADVDRVFLMGYSHGGYGAFFIGPKIPDRFAAVHASASAPTDGTISAKNLRNTRFTFMVGDKDTAYGRKERCEKFAAEIAELRKEHPGEYPVTFELKQGFGHGGLPDRDKIAAMYDARRVAAPPHLTWEPTDALLKDFFWVSMEKPARGQSIRVDAVDNKLLVKTDKVGAFTLCIDRRLANFDAPVEIAINGKTEKRTLRPSVATLCESIRRRGDPSLAGTVRLDLIGDAVAVKD